MTAVLVAAITVAAGAPASAIIGGEDVRRPISFAVSLPFDHRGNPDWHKCGGTLRAAQWVQLNAHCVSNPDGSAEAGGIYHVRVGSLDRLSSGAVAGVDQILVNPAWAWAQPPGIVADVAVIHLDRPVSLAPAAVAHQVPVGGPTRIIGWGLEAVDAPDVPQRLKQMDTRILPAAECAAGGITAGEICVAGHEGAAACYGDSGSPALVWQHHRRVDVGSASRFGGTVECGSNSIYTSAVYWESWVRCTIRTRTACPNTPQPQALQPLTASVQPHWLGELD